MSARILRGHSMAPWGAACRRSVFLLRMLIAGGESGRMGMSMSGPWCFSAPVGMHTVQRGWLDRGSVLRGGAGLLSSGVHEARTPQSGASKDIHTTQSVQSGARKYGRSPILSLGPGLVRAVFVRRPSERNKSPYVGDVQLEDGGRVALAHMPSMGMGGKVKEGSEVLLKVAVDAKGRPVGANATGKWNTPKCEFIMQLLRITESEPSGGCLVGANPAIGEKLAAELLNSGALDEALGAAVVQVEKQVQSPAATDMRCDFLVTLSDGSRTVLEVKTVVDSDHDPMTHAASKGRKSDQALPHVRAATFPWGTRRQVGPDGEKVVSARAIKHVRELAKIARGECEKQDGTRLGAALLFVVVRGDCEKMRPNKEACASFARHLCDAEATGVRVIARRISWCDDGRAFDDGPIPVDLS